MIKAIIIDDEKLARDVVRAYLKEHEDIRVVAECENGFEGIKAIQEHQPELIFLDIQMPKLTGFEMLEVLDHTPVIIFSTAYDEFALKAFELNSADYLLKPYGKDRFNAAIEKAREKIQAREEPKALTRALIETRNEAIEELDRVVIKNGNKILILSVHDIDYFEAQDDYVAVYAAGKKYLKKMTMKWLENALPGQQFVRVHRSYILAVSIIDKLEAYSKDSYLALLKSGDKIPVSRTGYQALRQVLDF